MNGALTVAGGVYEGAGAAESKARAEGIGIGLAELLGTLLTIAVGEVSSDNKHNNNKIRKRNQQLVKHTAICIWVQVVGGVGHSRNDETSGEGRIRGAVL